MASNLAPSQSTDPFLGFSFIFPELLSINLTMFFLILKNKTNTDIWTLSHDLKALSNLAPTYL